MACLAPRRPACYAPTVTDQARVLILSASIGGGHVVTGRALEAAFLAQGATAAHVDLLEHTAVPFRRLYRQAYFDLVRTMPDLVEWVGRRFDRRPSEYKTVQERLRARVTRTLSYEVPRIIERYRPDVVVHTHFLGAEIMSGRMRRHRPLPQAVVITDFFSHAFWLQPGVARYFVASDDVRAQLLAAGVDEHRVRVTGIPIDAGFSQLPSREAARSSLGTHPDRDVLLLLASGLGAATLKRILEQLTSFRWPLHVMVVCGRSQQLGAVAQSFVERVEAPVTLSVSGFVSDMPLRMAAATLLVSKPGGLTSSEALAAGLPLMLVSPYPLQEEANANVLLEHGTAVRVEPISTFSHKLRKLLESPERLLQMRANCAELARPDAASNVAATVLDELVPRGRTGRPR